MCQPWMQGAAALVVAAVGGATAVSAQTTFTYQGYLQDAGAAADGLYDFRVLGFNAEMGGDQLAVQIFDDVDVDNGVFTLDIMPNSLDPNAPPFFNGEDRWLEIGVRPGLSGAFDLFTTLADRIKVQASPYALRSLSQSFTKDKY